MLDETKTTEQPERTTTAPGLATDEIPMEIITPDEIREEVRLARIRPRVLAQVADYLKDPERGALQLNAFRDLVRTLRLTSIHLTYPSDWVLHVVDNDGRLITTGYLQDIGAERAAQVWGISRLGNAQKVREVLEDQTYIYYFEADWICERTGVILEAVRGARWSGEEFFRRRAAKSGNILNPLWVEQAAYRNLHGRAVRSLGGLAGIPEEELRAAGLDTTKCPIVRWGAAGAEHREGERPVRGRTARDELFGLLKARAEARKSNVPKLLRELCKEKGLAEKDSVAQLTDSQVADLLIVLRDEGQGPKPAAENGTLFGGTKA
jgi:hypothetical protein